MLPRISTMVAIGATALLTLVVATPASAGPSPATKANKTKQCSKLDLKLAAKAPGSRAFRKVAKKALSDGCVAYVSTSSSTSELELEFVRGPNTGQAISIGAVATGIGGVSLTDLAMTSSGTLYGIDDTSDLYSINPNTGLATLVASLGSFVNGLIVGPTGTMYASGGSDLFRIDPITGTETLVGSTGFSSSGDLAFAQDGALYMTAQDTPDDSLVTLDPATFAGTFVGNIGQPNVYGLVSSYGTLFGATDGGDLLTINQSTGVGTVSATGGPSVNGMASPPNLT